MPDWFADFDSHKKIDLKKDWLVISDKQIKRDADCYTKKYNDLYKALEKKSSLKKLDLDIIFALLALLIASRFVINRYYFSSASRINSYDEIEDYMPASIESLLSDHTVPYDAAQKSNNFFVNHSINAKSSDSNCHAQVLGSDPILGWLIGTANIATNTLTIYDNYTFSSYHVINQQIDRPTSFFQIINWCLDLAQTKPEILALSLAKQAMHYNADIFISLNLPTPNANILSYNAAHYLAKEKMHIDLQNMSRNKAIKTFINNLMGMIYRLWVDPCEEEEAIYKKRTQKVLHYSNLLTKMSKTSPTFTKLANLDIGNIAVTLWQSFSDQKKIEELKYKFIDKVINDDLKKEEEEINKKLCKMGYNI